MVTPIELRRALAERVLHCSTTTPLGAGGVYTSTWQRLALEPAAAAAVIPAYTSRYRIRGIVRANQASALNGFTIDFSNDGVNVHSQVTQSLLANIPLNFDIMLFGQFVRVTLQNAGVAQTSLTLLAYLVEV